MNYRKIEKLSLITLFVLGTVLIFFGKKYSLGMFLGGFGGLLGFKMIQKMENIQLDDYRELKGNLRVNHLLRYSVYALVMLASFLRPSVFSIFTCVIGLLLTKVWIVIVETRMTKEEKA